jgi:predicted DNA-binding mobile mystery protein A
MVLQKSLQRQQLNAKMQAIAALQKIAIPPTGWLKAIRLALGISSQNLAGKLGVTRQAIRDMEKRERAGSITIRTLEEAGSALDMQLVYGFVPKDGDLETLIDRKARELATKIVLRTSNTMKLEDQENSQQRIQKAIEEQVAALKYEMPKALWE